VPGLTSRPARRAGNHQAPRSSPLTRIPLNCCAPTVKTRLVLAFAAYLRGYLDTTAAARLHAIRLSVKRATELQFLILKRKRLGRVLCAKISTAAMRIFSRACGWTRWGMSGRSRNWLGYASFMSGRHEACAQPS